MAESELDRLARALKAADAAGDEEGAKKLAAEIRKKRIEGRSALSRFDAGGFVGVAKTIGAPTDLVNAMLSAFGQGSEEPFGGSRSIQRGLANLGFGVQPGDEGHLGRAGRVGEVIGAVAATGPAIVAGGLRSAAVQTLTRQPSITGRIVQGIAETAVKTPGRFTAGELTAATAAGLAGFEAAQKWPDSPGAQAMAELAGGFTPAAAVPVVRGTVRVAITAFEKIPLLGPAIVKGVRSLFASLTVRGGRRRAEARVKRAVEDPVIAAARLKRKDVLTNAPLTGAQRIEEGNLLALERSVMESTPELSIARQRQLAEVNQTIQNAMLEPVREIPTQQVKSYLQNLLDTRLSIAAARADERLAALGTKATREDLNRIAREEILSAKRAARAQESQLHESIPQDARVPTRAGQEAYIDFQLNLSAAERGDIPKVAKRLMDPRSKQFLGANTTVKEIRGLQGKLREEARIARSAEKFNRARIADDLADSLNDDIANAVGGSEVREAVDVAVAFSRDLNDRFTRGAVGKLLGSQRSGGVAVPEGLTLEVTVGARGARAREDTDALLEAVRRSGDEAELRGYIADFLMDDFRRSAVRGGRVDTKAAERYLRENQDVLARFPETRRAMDQARIAGGELAAAERLADPRVSRAAVFINAPPAREIERVIATAKPGEAMKELVAMARTDPTGKAEEGLKAAFTNFLLRRAELHNKLTAAGAGEGLGDIPFISGSRLSKAIDDPEIFEAMQGLYTREELARINKIRKTALLLDRARGAKVAGEGVIGDMPGQVTSIIARIFSAQMGRVIAGKTGGGTVQTPGIMAAQAQKLLKAGVQDPARRLLNDAIQKDSLLEALLLPMNTRAQEQAVRVRMNAWVIDVLTEQFEYDDDEEE